MTEMEKIESLIRMIAGTALLLVFALWFFRDVKSADGTVTNWGFELNGVNVLRRAGWTRDSLKAGDVLTVEGNPARNGGHTANARAITFTNTGQKLLESTAAAANPQ